MREISYSSFCKLGGLRNDRLSKTTYYGRERYWVTGDGVVHAVAGV